MNDYRIERLIGIGGAAVVYEARPLLPGGDGPPVACKLMREDRRAEPVSRALVKQEAALGLRVTPGHPNLARVLEYIEGTGDGPCIVMELVHGGSLKALLEPDRRLPFPCTRRIIKEVLQALAHLHAVDVLHRDLSPCNILISTTGSVKVADLGIARVMERGQTCTKNYRGKLPYDSPEGIQTLTLDARSDLYTLGAVLYELLVGTPPCGDAETFADIVLKTLRGDFAPLPPDIPPDLAGLAMGLLRTEREAREPQTATGALAWLRRHDQPMASEAELAALVMAMKSQRGAEPDGAGRAPSLAPGEMLEAGDLVARAAQEPGELLAPGDVLVARAVLQSGEPMPEAMPALPPAPSPVFPLPAEPPLPPLPQPPPRVTAQHAGSGPGGSSRDVRLDDAGPEQRRSHEQRVRPAQSRDHARRPRSSGAARSASPSRPRGDATIRAVGGALLGVCVLVSGFLLHDWIHGERSTGIIQQRPDVPVAVPAPAPPVQVMPQRVAESVLPAPVPIRLETPEFRAKSGRTTERPRILKRAGDPPRERGEMQPESQRTGPARARRPEPLGGEPPSWGAP